MTNEDRSSDQTVHSTATGDPHSDTDSSNDDGSGRSIAATRREVLAATGALSLGTATCLGTAAGATGSVGPDTFEEFEAAVDESLQTAESVIDQGPYEPTWDSLEDVDQVPEWFRDGKFGIYFHWGLYSVPAFSTEWYPKWMYIPDREGWGDEVYDYHVDNYGEPDEYPYQDFAEEFTAPAFDPEDWATLFDDAGAQFAGPVAEHHDGWANWASSINPYNAADMGPERDIVGELESSIRDRDMRFVTTFHHGRPAKKREGLEDKYFEGAYENYPSVTEGFPDRIMYRNVGTDLRWDMWFGKLVDAIERYEPDLVWHDSIHNPPEAVKQRYLAYNYNRAAEEDRDIAITQKADALPLDVSIEDFENERPVRMLDQAWLTDTTLSTGAWSYTEDQEYKPSEQVIHTLVDIVSKNGQMLLNLSPRADGTIPQAQRDRLQDVGDWLDVNGEAVYETRPWDLYGTGPNWLGGYSSEDVRYTQSKDGETVYAIVLGWPDAGELTLNGTYVEDPSNAPGTPPGHGGDPPGQGEPSAETGPAEVTLLGHGSVSHGVDESNHVVVDVPDLDGDERPSDHAVVFKLEGFDLQGLTADYGTSADDIHTVRVDEGVHEIDVTVYNFARGESPPVKVRAENASTGTVIGEAEIDSLSLYGNTDVTFEWDTSDIEDGTDQELRIVIDPDDEVPEQDESNNAVTKTVTIPAWPVDLVPSKVEVTDMTPGSSAELSVNVENQGTEAADETAVILSDTTSDTSTQLAELSVPPLEAGESAEVSYSWDISDFDTGTVRTVEAVVDPNDAISERDEDNNAASTSVELLDPLPSNYETHASTDAYFGSWEGNPVVNANGVDIWDGSDQYGAIYDPETVIGESATVTVKVVDQEITGGWAKTGLMIRNDVTAAGESTGYAALMVTGDNGFEFEWDADGDGFVDSSQNDGNSARPCWLRLEKAGTTFTASFSTDGSSWTEIGSADVPEATDAQNVAMFATSHTQSELGRAEFDQFEVQ